MNLDKQKITKAIDDLFKSNKGLSNAYNSEDLKLLWKEMMPADVLNYTKRIKFASGKLIITISSAPLRQNLIFRSEELMDEMNKKIKTSQITQLIFN